MSLALLSACATERTLFNGENLQGWRTQGAGDWQVINGSIVASGAGDRFLATEEQFGNFHLQLEFWADASVNSGVFIRCQNRERIYPDTCYELNIWDRHPKPEARTGAIVFKHMPPLAHVDTIERWNRYDIVARDGELTVEVNGVLTAALDDADPTPGFIALQHWGEGTVMFRNLSVRRLP
jgi:hypothetical protein